MKKIMVLFAVIIIFAACKKSSPVIDKSLTQALTTDINDPGKYTSVNIHGQQWMTTNLAVTHYRNGDKIPEVRGNKAWVILTTGAWCWYGKDSATGAPYGRLYNWYAVNDPRGLAPTGWHVPSDAEWDSLSTHLGNNAGGKLKETGTTHWLAPNTGATNKSGFTALPGGLRGNQLGEFERIGMYGYWWSSTESDASNAWYHGLYYDDGLIFRYNHYFPYGDKVNGFSVRCLRD